MWQIYSDSRLNFQCFSIGRRKTVKLSILIHSGYTLRHGVFWLFLISSWCISNSSRLNCNRSTPIPMWTPIALPVGENWLSTRGYWFSVNGTRSKRYVRCLKWIPNEFQTVPDGTVTDFLQYCLNSLWVYIGQNRVSNCGCRLSVDGTWSREYSKGFKAVPNEIQTVPDGTATNLLWFWSALPQL